MKNNTIKKSETDNSFDRNGKVVQVITIRQSKGVSKIKDPCIGERVKRGYIKGVNEVEEGLEQ